MLRYLLPGIKILLICLMDDLTVSYDQNCPARRNGIDDDG